MLISAAVLIKFRRIWSIFLATSDTLFVKAQYRRFLRKLKLSDVWIVWRLESKILDSNFRPKDMANCWQSV